MRDEEAGIIYNTLVEYGYSLNEYNFELSEFIDLFLQKVFSEFSQNIRFNEYMINVSFISKKNMEYAFKFITKYLDYNATDVDLFIEKIDEEKELQKAKDEKVRKEKISKAKHKIIDLQKQISDLKDVQEENNKELNFFIAKSSNKIADLTNKYNENMKHLDNLKTKFNLEKITAEKKWVEKNYRKLVGEEDKKLTENKLKLDTSQAKTKESIKIKEEEIKKWEDILQNVKNEENKALFYFPEEEINTKNYIYADNENIKIDKFIIGENTWLLNLIFPKKYSSFKFNKKNSVNSFLKKLQKLKKNSNYAEYLNKIDQLKDKRINLSNSGTKLEIEKLDNSINELEQQQVMVNLNINNIMNENIIKNIVKEPAQITNETIYNEENSFPEDEIIDIGGSSGGKLKRIPNLDQISNVMNEENNIINTNSAMNEENDIINTSIDFIDTYGAMNEKDDIINTNSKKRKFTPNPKRNSHAEDKEDEKEDIKVEKDNNISDEDKDNSKYYFDEYYFIDD